VLAIAEALTAWAAHVYALAVDRTLERARRRGAVQHAKVMAAVRARAQDQFVAAWKGACSVAKAT
jgi:hypothetical protein